MNISALAFIVNCSTQSIVISILYQNKGKDSLTEKLQEDYFLKPIKQYFKKIS